MKADYTHITVILDRTGSMESIRDDTIGGFNAFLQAQQAEPGEATLTLVQFDSQDPYEVLHHFKPVAEIPELTRETYVPRASTPLLDAFGRGINDLEASLNKLPEAERPARVIFAVVTDGQENSSREFRKEQIEQMVRDKTEKHDWQFVFLSADLAAMRDAMGVGVHSDRILHFQKTGQGTREAWSALSKDMADYRSDRKRRMGFVEEDRQPPDDPGKEQ
jgi:hypothetical protein